MSLRFLISQQNFFVGAIENNAQQMIEVIERYQAQSSVDVIIFPELSLTGYPPEDWLFRTEFQHRVELALKKTQDSVKETYVIVGHPSFSREGCFNTASVLHQGKIVTQYYKQLLPNYGIFDEKRYFTPGNTPCVFDVKGEKIGLLICEDLWGPGPWKKAVEAGAKLIISPNASPFERHKREEREAVIRKRQQMEGKVPVIYVHGVGGQDELVFDGQSFVMNAEGEVCWRGKAFEPDEHVLSLFDFSTNDHESLKKNHAQEALIYKALVLGTRDYVQKNGFKGVLLGLSGGIDSALTLAIAVDALGADAVEAVMMPSRYTADMSLEDAQAEIKALNISSRLISIEPTFNAFLSSFPAPLNNITQQNLQARCRGTLLMALSNETGKLLLTTGNKSELAVGYCTLYGDMNGGFAVLKDVLKTWVYRLAHYRNTLSAVIPERVLTRAPSAELAPDQTDQDSLPPYEILDSIIEQYVEKRQSPEIIVSSGIDATIVERVIRLIHLNEYKRRQAAPGVKISHCAFGKEWRYPMTQGVI
jgi:NAD+ synthase (glutamine-hydrolysing)